MTLKSLVKQVGAVLLALAFFATVAPAAAQQPSPPEEEPPPPPPDEEELPRAEEADPADEPPPPAPADARQQPPPPGYGQPPPPGGYPPGYGYGLPPGAVVGPAVIDDYEEGDPIPPGYQPDTKIRKGLVIGGAVTFGAMWIVSIIIAAFALEVEELDEADGVDSDGISTTDVSMLFIPVAGPFISIVTYDAGGGGTAFFIIDGLAQTGGLAMLIAGLAAQKTVLVRTPYAELTAAPLVGQGQSGAALVGKF